MHDGPRDIRPQIIKSGPDCEGYKLHFEIRIWHYIWSGTADEHLQVVGIQRFQPSITISQIQLPVFYDYLP